MMRRTAIHFWSFSLAIFTSAASASHTVMSFNDAWRLTEKYNATLQAANWQQTASRGLLTQSRLLPNPSLAVSFENVAGSGIYHGTNAAEITYQLSEPILLGHKRYARQQAAFSNFQLQSNNFNLVRASLYTKFGQHFVDVLVAEQWLSVCQRMARMNRSVVDAIHKRMQAGRASAFDLNRAEVLFGDANLQVSQAEMQLANARSTLATYWGSATLPAVHLTEEGLPHNLPNILHCKSCLLQSPALATYRSIVQNAHAKIAVSKSDSWPDANVGVGLRNFNQTRDHALVAVLAVPLPIFDRNQGNQFEAHANYSRSVAEAQQATLDLQQQVLSLYHSAQQASRELHLTGTSLLPKARNAFALAKDGFLQGRYSYIELSSAQQLLLTEEQHYWQAHAAHDKAVISLTGLLGTFPHNIRGDHGKSDIQ